MTYKGYTARIDYSEEDGCFVGHITGISDIVGFHGEMLQNFAPPLKKRSMTTSKPAKNGIVLPKNHCLTISW